MAIPRVNRRAPVRRRRAKATDGEAETVCSQECDDVRRLLGVTWMEANVGYCSTMPTAK